MCGCETWNGSPVGLVLDHIDGDSSNNMAANLRVVCGNCDMQLPTYKGRNKGRGRHSRRLRYQLGKSY
ncbi:endonuclease [Candidatus Woesearchaeota archaeon]|nr:endonuclease [Candidatus Woesearchaeota archaeon]